MANGHGGARKGAGRKAKKLVDKIMDGNPGNRPMKKLGFASSVAESKTPPEYLHIMRRKKTQGGHTFAYRNLQAGY